MVAEVIAVVAGVVAIMVGAEVAEVPMVVEAGAPIAADRLRTRITNSWSNIPARSALRDGPFFP